MTVLLDQAVSDLAANYGVIYQFEEEPELLKVDHETWEEIREYRNFLDQMDYQIYRDEIENIKREQDEAFIGRV